MARIVVVHGVGQQFEGEHTLHARLFPALRDGLARAGMKAEADDAVFPSYGQVFRPAAEVLASDPYEVSDVSNVYETDLLRAWWLRAAAADERVIPPEEETLGRSPRWTQRALLALSRSRFFSGVAGQALAGDLRQVRTYFTDPVVRAAARAAVVQRISGETRVLVGHSLGSVVAYEVLCAHPQWPVRALVTLGSPLGLRHLIFDRLDPAPQRNGTAIRGNWPGRVTAWTNVTDSGDVVTIFNCRCRWW